MGIQGLLPLLRSIHKPTHLRNFSGQTLGVDAYGWLHRGTIACAIELAEGKPTRKHIDFALHRVRMLIHFGVKPYIVFDGDYLPGKEHTEKDRAARRKESRRKGLDLLRMGRTSQAQLELQRAVDVTPTMARELIEELKRLDVPYIVAPYEADSQLAYLERENIIQGVISEDSDLLVFGVNCLLTKLDQYGECVMVNRKDFTACRDISLVGWSDREFRMMAMLSGCDYLPGIDRMGLKTAWRLIRKHKTLERVVRTVQFDGKMRVSAGYLKAFQNAERTFLYQWIFCPKAKALLNLNTLPIGLEASSMPYIGKFVDPEVASGVACGELHPNTKEPIVLPDRFAHRARHHQIVHTPDEKQGKPITEFFKKRTPLAELDPNSFTPTNSQQQLLVASRNASWSSSQVPTARIFGHSESSSIPVPSSAPQASRRAVTDPFASTRRSPPKRQRLCPDSGLAAAMGGTKNMHEATTSRFFTKTVVQPSPSIRKGSRNKADEFELWSDDSAMEAAAAASAALIETPRTANSASRKRKKFEVFTDPAQKQDESNVEDTSQDSITTNFTSTSDDASAVVTPDTSFESTSPAQAYSSINRGIKAHLNDLRRRYSHAAQASPLRSNPTSLFASTPLRYSKCPESLEKAETQESIDGKHEIEVPFSSPLAMAKETSSHQLNGESFDGQEEEESDSFNQQLMFDQFVGVVKGSEDFLVPESPEPSDDGVLDKLNLARFSYAG